MINPTDTLHLRAAIALSARARAAGNMPYGALLVGSDGRVLAVAQNTQISERDCTGHAETNLMRAATHKLDAASLADSTVYASGEPCAMCVGAIYWGGVRRVVYALSIASMRELGGPDGDELLLSCLEVWRAACARSTLPGRRCRKKPGASFAPDRLPQNPGWRLGFAQAGGGFLRMSPARLPRDRFHNQTT